MPAQGWCQTGDPESAEVAAYVGGLFGLGAHPYVGASAGLAAGRHVICVGDISWAPLGGYTIRTRPASQMIQESRLYDFNFSAHVQIPINKKFAPYAILGPSVLWNNFTTTTVASSGQGVRVSDNNVNFGFHTGAGARYYVRNDWGIRPEVRVVISNKTYVVASLGFFYTFPNEAP